MSSGIPPPILALANANLASLSDYLSSAHNMHQGDPFLTVHQSSGLSM
ncbi:MAG: hypothetical protein HY735_01505 [Verrucomicrobia bacterium]|nr:hypothetical protein [Verrucomicrobiota bacterium]